MTQEAYEELREATVPISTVLRISAAELQKPGAILDFYRTYVSQSMPVVISGLGYEDFDFETPLRGDGQRFDFLPRFASESLVHDWPCLTKWRGKGSTSDARAGFGIDGDYLANAMKKRRRKRGVEEEEEQEGTEQTEDEIDDEDAKVTVALTPNGWADAITELNILPCSNNSCSTGTTEKDERRINVLLGPAEKQMTLPELLRKLERQNRTRVHQPLEDTSGKLNYRKSVVVSEIQQRDEKGHAVYKLEADQLSLPQKACGGSVAYAQFQNNSLEAEFPQLKDDLDDRIKNFGEELFGVSCDASNIWIGSDASVTSMHQDWYENLYVVVAGGVKHFDLVSPWEAPLLEKKEFPDGEWRLAAKDPNDGKDQIEKGGGGTQDNHSFEILVRFAEDDRAPWVSKDVADPREIFHSVGRVEGGSSSDGSLGTTTTSSSTKPKVLSVDVYPGEVLYLPAMWFHRVSHKTFLRSSPALQHDHDGSGEGERGEQHKDMSTSNVPAVVAVNYWFDMQFSSPLFHLQEYLKQTL